MLHLEARGTLRRDLGLDDGRECDGDRVDHVGSERRESHPDWDIRVRKIHCA